MLVILVCRDMLGFLINFANSSPYRLAVDEETVGWQISWMNGHASDKSWKCEWRTPTSSQAMGGHVIPRLVALVFSLLPLVSKAFGLTRLKGRLLFTHGPLWARHFKYLASFVHELCNVSLIILPFISGESETQRT